MKKHTPILPLLTVFLVSLYPCAFSYLENAGEASPGDMLPMLGIFFSAGILLFLLGLFLFRQSAAAGLWSGVGVLLFATAVVFQLVTLPVEFNASRRAIASLEGTHLLEDDELRGARKVLGAAAMTYVAALLVSLAQLLRFLLAFAGRRRD